MGHRLLKNAHRLSHLLHFKRIPVKTVTNGTDRNIKIKTVIDGVGIIFTNIVRNPRCPQHCPAAAIGKSKFFGEDADVFCTFLKNNVSCEQSVVFIKGFVHYFNHLFNPWNKGIRDIGKRASRPKKIHGQPGAAEFFEDICYQLTLLKPIEKGSNSPKIHAGNTPPEKVRLDALQLTDHDPDIFSTLRNPDFQGLFHGHAVPEIVNMTREIIEAIREVNILDISLAFCYLFKASMNIAKVGNHLQNVFAVKS